MLKVVSILMMMMASAVADDLATAKADYAKQDKELNEIYGKLKKEIDPPVFAKMQETQRDWLAFRDYIAD